MKAFREVLRGPEKKVEKVVSKPIQLDASMPPPIIQVIGADNVGKSNVILKMTNPSASFNESRLSGSDISNLREIKVRGKQTAKIADDFSSADKKANPKLSYNRNTNVLLLMYDVTDYKSFEYLKKQLQEHSMEVFKDDVRMILVGTKSDLVNQRTVQESAAKEFANEVGADYIEISAKSGNNVERLADVATLRGQESVKNRSDQLEESEEKYVDSTVAQLLQAANEATARKRFIPALALFADHCQKKLTAISSGKIEGIDRDVVEMLKRNLEVIKKYPAELAKLPDADKDKDIAMATAAFKKTFNSIINNTSVKDETIKKIIDNVATEMISSLDSGKVPFVPSSAPPLYNSLIATAGRQEKPREIKPSTALPYADMSSQEKFEKEKARVAKLLKDEDAKRERKNPFEGYSESLTGELITFIQDQVQYPPTTDSIVRDRVDWDTFIEQLTPEARDELLNFNQKLIEIPVTLNNKRYDLIDLINLKPDANDMRRDPTTSQLFKLSDIKPDYQFQSDLESRVDEMETRQGRPSP